MTAATITGAWLAGMTAGEAELFRAKVNVDPDGCWLWTASTTSRGYPQLKFRRRIVRGHRVSYEQTVGPIPDGLDLDHLCSVPLCVRPDHLEPVSHRENYRRSNHPSAHALRTGECVNGHTLDAENTRVRSNGSRECKECSRARTRAWREKQR